MKQGRMICGKRCRGTYAFADVPFFMARPGISPVRRCWKGFLFEVIDELEEKGLISQGRRGNKSVYITEEGEKLAEELKGKFGLREGK